MQICVENLQKTFKIKTGGFLKARKVTNVEAVQNVSFEVEKGEIVAFIGPNGAGKSTTIKMLTGIIQPSGGKISVAGFNPSCVIVPASSIDFIFHPAILFELFDCQ